MENKENTIKKDSRKLVHKGKVIPGNTVDEQLQNA
jgi:hypothetical protein